jgi:hypothetical protein
LEDKGDKEEFISLPPTSRLSHSTRRGKSNFILDEGRINFNRRGEQ